MVDMLAKLSNGQNRQTEKARLVLIGRYLPNLKQMLPKFGRACVIECCLEVQKYAARSNSFYYGRHACKLVKWPKSSNRKSAFGLNRSLLAKSRANAPKVWSCLCNRVLPRSAKIFCSIEFVLLWSTCLQSCQMAKNVKQKKRVWS